MGILLVKKLSKETVAHIHINTTEGGSGLCSYDGATLSIELATDAEMKQAYNDMLRGHIRARRNALMTATDWTQLPDVSTATREKWTVYRQALRDITNQADPANITWPTPPGAI